MLPTNTGKGKLMLPIRITRLIVPCTLLAVISAARPAVHAAGNLSEPSEAAQQVLKQSGICGGLIVHLGCRDGRLIAALAPGKQFLVQALTTDPQVLTAARKDIRSLGIYGQVSVDRYDGQHLPYADNLVNLLVVDHPEQVSQQEMMRVLAPGGVLLQKQGGSWKKTVKPWPATIDQWNHYLHDASNNAVAADRQVSPPRRLRWKCGPLWSRSHEFISSLCAMITAGGRLFYIFDEGLTGITTPELPERWTLTARDAFNGVLLWKRSVPKWGSRFWGNSALRNAPASVPRRLVADARRVYVTLGIGEPVSILDAATGQVQSTVPGTETAEELRLLDGVLLVRTAGALLATEAASGKLLWKADGKLQPLSLAAADRRVYYRKGKQIVCRQLADGEVVWQSALDGPVSLLVVHDDSLFLLQRGIIVALSASTGEKLWSVRVPWQRAELFVAAGKLWHWQAGMLVGRNLQTGALEKQLDTSDVFTPGHHLRCYASKATDEFIITPNRGAEFVSICGKRSAENDWLRGACRYGVMPGNGLLYVPPHPCFCYPGVMLTGMNALAGSDDWQPPAAAELGTQLEPGPAAAAAAKAALASAGQYDWPTYRHDARRSGATMCSVPAQVTEKWKVNLPRPITPPIVADGRLFVAAKDEHTLYAIDAGDGHILWQFTAGGPIDSPPTVCGDLLLLGCCDGYVYCLMADNGALAWRFRAAPREERIVAFGQLQSPWPVHGSVLVVDQVAYVTAGRSSYLDGGIWLYALEPRSGRVLYRNRIDTWSPTRRDAVDKPFVPAYHIEGARSDILVSEGGHIYLGQYKFDMQLVEQPAPYILPKAQEKATPPDFSKHPYAANMADELADFERRQREWLERTQPDLLAKLRQRFGGFDVGCRQMGRHLLSTAGFLDDSWYNRTFWMYADIWPGYYLAHLAPKTGQLIVVGPTTTYALQAFPTRNFQSPLFFPGKQGYALMADRNDNEPVLDDQTLETTKGWGFVRAAPPVWFRWVPVRVRGMVLAGDRLFVAGPPDVVDPHDPMAAFEGRKGARLQVYSAADGKPLAEKPLDAPPVFDGVIAAEQHLFVSTVAGQVVCLQGR